MLRTRALSALVLVPPVLAALAVGLPAIAALLAVVATIGAWEAFRLLRAAGWPGLHLLGTALAVALVLEAAWAPGGERAALVLGLGCVLAGVGALGRRDAHEGLVAWFATVAGAVYVGLLAFVLQLAVIAPAVPAGAALAPLGAERGWILLLLLGVWSFDTGAYLVGRTLGRHRFIPHVSPAKTVEGVVGGLVATTAVSALVLGALGQAPAGALVLGPLLGLAAQAGDLAESMLKRAAGAKDSGTLIPGHGGILDRVDSFLFAAPAVTLYVLALGR